MPPATRSDTLDVIIRVRDAATRRLRGVEKGLDRIRNRLRTMPRAVFNLKTAFAGLGLGLIARSFVQAADTAEQYETRLKVLLGSAAEGKAVFKDMADTAARVPFEFEKIMGAATTLAGVMEGGREEINRWMPGILDLAAATGLSVEETTGNIVRMYSAGAASADLFRDRGILAALGFQAGVSYSAEETRKKLLEVFEDPAGKFAGATAGLAKTWTGLMSMMGDQWFQFRNLVMEAGLLDYIKGIVQVVLDFIQNLRERGQLEEWARGIAQNVIGVIEALIKGGAGVLDIWRGLQMVFEGVKLAFFVLADAYFSVLSAMGGAAAKFVGIWDKDLAAAMTATADHFNGKAAEMAVKAGKSIETLDKLSLEESYWSRAGNLIDAIRAKQAEFATAVEDDAKKISLLPPVDKKLVAAQTKATLEKLKETNKTVLVELENLYERGSIELQKYFDDRKRILEESYQAELAAAKKAAEGLTGAEQVKAQQKIFALEEQHRRDLLELDQWYYDENKKLQENDLARRELMSDLKFRAEQTAAGNLQAVFDQELRDMDFRHEEELQRLRDLNAKKTEIDEAYRLQKLEKDKLLADQTRRLFEYQLQLLADVAGGFKDVFNEVYELGGKKRKEFFYLSKAAALAEAIINTAQAVTKALAQGGIWGIAQGAIIGAKGAIQIAKITAQTLASGGVVAGTSPSARADDKLVRVTSGEFVQPVDTVKHYGLGIMEAIRKRAIPKNLFSGFSIPTPPRPRFAFQTGGAVTSTPTAGEGIMLEANIFNISDQGEFERQLASARGRNAVINFMGQNARTIRRLLK